MFVLLLRPHSRRRPTSKLQLMHLPAHVFYFVRYICNYNNNNINNSSKNDDDDDEKERMASYSRSSHKNYKKN